MIKPVHIEAVELLLASMSRQSGDGVLSSFTFGKPRAPHWQRRMGVELYYNRKSLIRAAIYIRRNGPPYIKCLAIGDIWSLLQSFVSENFWHMADEVCFKPVEGNFAKVVSNETKFKLAGAIAVSEIFQPRNQLTLFPLVPVQVKADFDSGPFFLVAPASLALMLPSQFDGRHVAGDRFPPLRDWKGRSELPAAWLGVRSPAVQVSNKMKAAILGALALLPLPRYRHLFSLRSVFGGSCTITDNMTATTAFGQSHTPPLMHDLIIRETDHAWLDKLAQILMADEPAVRRQLSALEYFYRAWELGPSERFPILFMALDAVFSEDGQATQSVIKGVREVLGPQIRDVRLTHLMRLRGSVIHGRAPDVYDSRDYASYYYRYEGDPVHDLELVVASCLHRKIFGDSLEAQPDPNADIIAKAQAQERLPRDLSRNTILEDAPPTETP